MTFRKSSGTAPVTRFVVIATQRTGSTWLTDMLDSHPAIAAYEELFFQAKTHDRTWGGTDWEFFHAYYARHAARQWPLARVFWSVRYLEELYAPRPGAEAVGLKLMYSQLRAYPWLLPYIALRRVRVVHLVRTNLLDLLLSRRTAEVRRQYHALASDAVDRSAVRLQADQVVFQLESLQRSIDRVRLILRLLPAPSIEISYEELGVGHGGLDDVVRFLNVVPQRLSSRLTKLNQDTKRALIANYDEVEFVLRGTRFEHFLAE